MSKPDSAIAIIPAHHFILHIDTYENIICGRREKKYANAPSHTHKTNSSDYMHAIYRESDRATEHHTNKVIIIWVLFLWSELNMIFAYRPSLHRAPHHITHRSHTQSTVIQSMLIIVLYT